MCKYIHCLYFSYHLIISQDFTFCKAKHRKKIIFLIISFFSVFNFILLATCLCFFYCVWCVCRSISTTCLDTRFERNDWAHTESVADVAAVQVAREERTEHVEHVSAAAIPFESERRQQPPISVTC